MSRYDEIEKIFFDVMGYKPTSHGDLFSVKSFASIDADDDSIVETFKGLKEARELAAKASAAKPVIEKPDDVKKPDDIKPTAKKPAKKTRKTSTKTKTKARAKSTKKARK